MRYKDLGEFSSLVPFLESRRPVTRGAPVSRSAVLDALGVPLGSLTPEDVQVHSSWAADDLLGEEVSWSVGFGPRTRAWVVRRQDLSEPAPGVLALHDHANLKWYGKEKIADGPATVPAAIRELRNTYYGGRAFVNHLARSGFVVACHDVFLWGSRRFSYGSMPEQVRRVASERARAIGYGEDQRGQAATYELAARQEEDVIAKYCNVLDTTLTGLVLREDMIALQYLGSRADVLAEPLACVGLSGGGTRAAFLRATAETPLVTVIVGAMATYSSLLDTHIARHSWLLFPPGLSAICDLPGLVMSGVPAPLLVQYNRDDRLFPLTGMRAADRAIARHFKDCDTDFYTGIFYDGPHKFDVAMQEDAFSWLASSVCQSR